MVLEKVLWTALPNHFDANGRLRISVHVAPRLVNHDGSSTPRKLEECPAFVDWPARLATLKFKVEFDSGATAEDCAGETDGALWSRLFPPDTHSTFAFQDHAARTARLPGAGVHQFVWQAHGAAGAQAPTIGDRRRLSGRRASRRSSISRRCRETRTPLSPARPLAQRATARSCTDRGRRSAAQQAVQNTPFEAYRFYHRPGSRTPTRLPTTSSRARRRRSSISTRESARCRPPAGAAPARAGRRSGRGPRCTRPDPATKRARDVGGQPPETLPLAA
jgi:hypothetical protein